MKIIRQHWVRSDRIRGVRKIVLIQEESLDSALLDKIDTLLDWWIKASDVERGMFFDEHYAAETT